MNRRLIRRAALALPLLAFLVPASALAASDGGASFTERLALFLSGSLESGQIWLALGAAALGGLLSALSPCVYPLIPVTIRYFGGMQGAKRGTVVRLAIIYVLGMALLYAALGTIVASLNIVFGSFLGNPWVLSAVALLCFAMGLSMLGLFAIQLPAGLNTRLSQVGGRSNLGAFAMGLVSGLIAAPCTGPVLVVILALISKTGNVGLGLSLMLAFSAGLGLPFLVLALSSSALQKVPSGGAWMEIVKFILATAMFVVSVYFLALGWPGLGELLHAVSYASAVGTVLLIAAIGLVAFYLVRLSRGGGGLLKSASVMVLTAGAVLVLLGGPSSQAASDAATGSTAAGDASGIAWQTTHEGGLALAKERHAPLMIDFTADWCLACKELEHKTYTDVRVREEAKRFVSVKIDATNINDAIDALFVRYGLQGLPAVIFIDSTGKVLDDPRVTGFVPPERFLALMAKVH